MSYRWWINRCYGLRALACEAGWSLCKHVSVGVARSCRSAEHEGQLLCRACVCLGGRALLFCSRVTACNTRAGDKLGACHLAVTQGAAGGCWRCICRGRDARDQMQQLCPRLIHVQIPSPQLSRWPRSCPLIRPVPTPTGPLPAAYGAGSGKQGSHSLRLAEPAPTYGAQGSRQRCLLLVTRARLLSMLRGNNWCGCRRLHCGGSAQPDAQAPSAGAFPAADGCHAHDQLPPHLAAAV